MEALSDQPKATLPSPGTQLQTEQDRNHGQMSWLTPESGLWQHQCCCGCAKIIREENPYSKTSDIFTMMPARPYLSCPTSSGCTGSNSHVDFVQNSKCCCSEYIFSFFISTE